jgi:hypothetical protein
MRHPAMALAMRRKHQVRYEEEKKKDLKRLRLESKLNHSRDTLAFLANPRECCQSLQ